MQFWKDESGQALVIATVSLAVLMGFLALAVDVGVLFHARRNVQLAADSAAVAASLDYKYNSANANALTTATAAAQAAAAANGISNTTSNVVVHIPPQNGPFAGGANGGGSYAEVLIQQPMTTTFTNFLDITNLHVAARAVAGPAPLNQAGEGCMWALAGSGSAVLINGTGSITASNCNIYDDSTASNALRLNGTGSITAKAIGVVGGSSDTGTGSISPSPTTGITAVANPLNLSAPSIPSGTCGGSFAACNPNNSGTGSMTLSPGNYTSITNSGTGTLTLNPGNYVINGNLKNSSTGGLVLGNGNYTINGTFSNPGTGPITLGSGLYIINGGLSLGGTGSITGNGVTFYMESGSASISGTGSMTVTAPTSGNYSGVLIFQPSSNASSMTIGGTGSAVFQGIVDAPSASLSLSGTGNMGISTDLIMSSISVSGTGTITNTNYAAVTNTNSVLNKIRMVE